MKITTDSAGAIMKGVLNSKLGHSGYILSIRSSISVQIWINFGQRFAMLTNASKVSKYCRAKTKRPENLL